MPYVPATSPATSNPVQPYFIHTINGQFMDSVGRVVLLRGVNLSGSDKAPVDKPSYLLEDFWETAENGGESFVGRPFKLDDLNDEDSELDSIDNGSYLNNNTTVGSSTHRLAEIDVHLSRLKGWGFNVLRYVVTWEALEHAGPRQYDFEFMDYTVRVLRKIKSYGFKVFMDPHQDVWSRFSGGSGAPFWTLPACGLNPRNFTASFSAIVHSEYPLASSPEPATLPAMIWSTNYSRLISQTVWTLFFAGRQFAPKAVIDGVNIQDYLQSHFIDAFGLLADRIRDAGDLMDECVIGWDSINEPGEGFIGIDDLRYIPKHQPNKLGPCPSPLQGLRLGMGTAQEVENWHFGAMGPSRDGTVTIDPAGRRVWSDPDTEIEGRHPKWGWTRSPEWKLGSCIWAQHGVWDTETQEALIPDYFLFSRTEDGSASTGEPASFTADYWRPWWQKYVKRIRSAHPESIQFIQPPVFVQPPPLDELDLAGRAAYSAHYYDGLTLMTRHWNWFNADALGLLRGKYHSVLQAVKIGSSAIRSSLQSQLGILKSDSLDIIGPYPTLIGEIGTPMDMDGKRSYGWTDGGKYKGHYTEQTKALDASLNGADGANALNYTMWTFCPDSSHKWGDGWNMEDLSIWSRDDLRNPSRPRSLDMPSSQSYGFVTSSSRSALLHSRSRATSTNTQGPPTIPELPSMDSLEVSINFPPLSARSQSYQLHSRQMTETSQDDFLKPDACVSFNPVITEQAVAFPKLQEPEPDCYDPATLLNPFAFLTDGTRAVGAFARPYPRATIGTPEKIEFDLGRATFKYSVIVSAGDTPCTRQIGEEGEVIKEEKKGLYSTEIFIPVVQFASKQYIAGVSDLTEDRSGSSSPDDDRCSATVSSSITLTVKDSTNTTSSTLPKSATPSLPTFSPSIPPSAYDITVTVPPGTTWTLDSENQTIHWSYPVPEYGEPDACYEIIVKRNGGAIKSLIDGTVSKSRMHMMESAEEMSTAKTLVDECCGGCIIA